MPCPAGRSAYQIHPNAVDLGGRADQRRFVEEARAAVEDLIQKAEATCNPYYLSVAPKPRLKKPVANQALDIDMLKDISAGNF